MTTKTQETAQRRPYISGKGELALRLAMKAGEYAMLVSGVYAATQEEGAMVALSAFGYMFANTVRTIVEDSETADKMATLEGRLKEGT